jgi:hypothetical protein
LVYLEWASGDAGEMQRGGARRYTSNALSMNRRRSVLTFRDPDGRLYAETLGRDSDFAELVDPDDGSVRHAGPFVMHGREWQIESVNVTDTLIRVMCVLTSATVEEARRRSGQPDWSVRA